MKKITLLFLFVLATTLGFAQNLITNGTFDDASGWTIINQWETNNTNGNVTIAGGNATWTNNADWAHMAIFQSVDLTAGWYQFDMDVDYAGINGIYGEVYLGAAMPVEGSATVGIEYNGDFQVIRAINSWECGDTYSGSAVASGCDTTSPGSFEITTDGTYYLLFRCGGQNYSGAGISIDNLTLVADSAQPVASFTETTSVSNLMATFSNTSTDATSYSWDFGDGSTSTDANPAAHTYAYKGQYFVALTATSAAGSNVSTKEIFVGAVTTPLTDFNFNFDSPTPLRTEDNLELTTGSGVGTLIGVNNGWWSQLKYVHNAGIDLSSVGRGISIKVKGPRTSVVTIKIEDGGPESVVVANYTTPDVWQELKFDFSSFTSNNNKKIAVFFDIQTDFDAGVDPNLNIFQVDDFVFGAFATLSIKDFEIEGLKAYPNPTNGQWKISTKDQEIQAIEVFNVLGKRVISLKPNAMLVNVDASGLAPGIYLTTITTQQGTSSRKLIKN